MNTLQEFHKPGKAYRQVKAEKKMLPDVHGKSMPHSVMVYMSTAGTPHFAIGVPKDYSNAWEHHRDADSRSWHSNLFVHDGMITASSFDEVLKKLETIAENFRRHISNLTMRKVICIAMEIKGEHPRDCHDAPSFSHSRLLVGIRSGLYWEVNGGYYTAPDSRHVLSAEDGRDVDSDERPAFNDLYPANRVPRDVVIPYTPQAWATVQQVEDMLERAGKMLMKLTKQDTAQALLEGGMQALALLAAPDSRT